MTSQLFFSLSTLPDLTVSISPDNKFNVCSLPRIQYFCDKYKNLGKEAVFIKEGALALAH
jgi:hypothetical protein